MIFEEFEEFIESDLHEVEWEDALDRKLTSPDMVDFLEDANDNMMDSIKQLLSGQSSVDYQEFFTDVNGDGIVDHVFGLDLDGDGKLDQLFTPQDINLDGMPDTVHTIMKIDMDQDGIMDSVIKGIVDLSYDSPNVISVMADMDGDGVLEAEATYKITDYGKIYMLDDDGFIGLGTGYEMYSPSSANQEHIIGNPTACLDNWHRQETDYSCGVAVQEFELEELLGREFEESELRQLGLEKGYVFDWGTPPEAVGKIIEHMGATVELTYGNDLSDIRECLANGIRPIVAVDSDELWSGKNEEYIAPGMDANHVVQVIGLDESDPNNPMVIFHDSGVMNGCGAMISADFFMDVWDADGYMVTAHM